MKRVLWIVGMLLLLVGLLAACGGQAVEPGAENAPAPAATTASDGLATAPTETSAEPVAIEPASGDTQPANSNAEAEPAGDMIAGRPASGIDPDTGLEINPATITPGVDYIVRGELVNHNLTPATSPEFMVISPAGVRYRIRSQALEQIFYEDGTQPAPFQYKRGMLIQATVRQEEGSAPTTLVNSTDLVLLQSE
mgnify:CR=1 FL=1